VGLEYVVTVMLQQLGEEGDVRRLVVDGEDQGALSFHGR
jgi:hypothetical protein